MKFYNQTIKLNHIIKLTCIDGSSNLTSLWVRDRVKLDSLPLELLDSEEGAGGEDENLKRVHHMFSLILNPEFFFPFVVCFDLFKMDLHLSIKIDYKMPIQILLLSKIHCPKLNMSTEKQSQWQWRQISFIFDE